MALVPVPPTSVYFLGSCAKPEAFSEIDAAVINQICAEETDAAVQEALSDRIPTGATVLQMDQGFVGWIVARSARRLMSSRGYDRQAGADEEIVEQATRADERITACGPLAPGGAGKRITPRFVHDASSNVVDGITVHSHSHADWFARPTGDPARTRPWTGS